MKAQPSAPRVRAFCNPNVRREHSTMEAHILDNYILKKYIKTFLLAMTLIIVIVITFDVSEKLDDFLSNHAPLSQIAFKYYLNFIPGFVNLYSPLFIFISVLFFTSKMAGNTEIIAILGSGISYRRLLVPYLYGSVIVAAIVLVLGNFIIPWSNQFLDEFESQYIRTMRHNYYSDVHFQTDENTQVYANSYDARGRNAFRFGKDTYGDDGRLTDRATADFIQFDTASGSWTVSNYYHRTINGLQEHVERIPTGKVDLGVMPEDFDRSSINITTLNSIKLIRHIRQETIRGSGAVITAKIELFQRLLNPLAIIVMTFIGVAVSSRKTRGGIGVHLAIGISIAFAFIVFMKITTVFAINGNLNPFLSVLLPQLIFGLAAAYLIRTAPK